MKFYLTVDSEGCLVWDNASGTAIVNLASPLYFDNFEKIYWFVCVIDYRAPLVDGGPGFGYLVCDFIENQNVNDKLLPILCPVRLSKTELQRNYTSGQVLKPVKRKLVTNPLSKFILSFVKSDGITFIKFLRSDFFITFKFESST